MATGLQKRAGMVVMTDVKYDKLEANPALIVHEALWRGFVGRWLNSGRGCSL
jgi:hypothetical protein